MGCWAHLRGVVLPFDPKPIQANFYFNLPFYYSIRMLQVCMFSVLFSSTGSHTNYSTKSMRNKGGYEVIKKAIEKPGLRHIGQIAASVKGNGQGLADRHETSDINTFKWVRGKGNNFLATQVLLLYLSSISFLTSCLIDRVLLIVGLPFVFNNEQYAL